MNDLDTYEKDLLRAIESCSHASEANILRNLYKKYNYHATMFFHDAIANLENTGKIVRMYQGGSTWWEID